MVAILDVFASVRARRKALIARVTATDRGCLAPSTFPTLAIRVGAVRAAFLSRDLLVDGRYVFRACRFVRMMSIPTEYLLCTLLPQSNKLLCNGNLEVIISAEQSATMDIVFFGGASFTKRWRPPDETDDEHQERWPRKQ